MTFARIYSHEPRPVLTGFQALRQTDELAAHCMDRTGNPEKFDMLEKHPSRIFSRDDDLFRPVAVAYASQEDMARRKEVEKRAQRRTMNELMRESIKVERERIRAFRLAPVATTLEPMATIPAGELPELPARTERENEIPALPPVKIRRR